MNECINSFCYISSTALEVFCWRMLVDVHTNDIWKQEPSVSLFFIFIFIFIFISLFFFFQLDFDYFNVILFVMLHFSILPPLAYQYTAPEEWYSTLGTYITLHFRTCVKFCNRIRRFGFHGISHCYVANRVAWFLEQLLSDLNLIIAHWVQCCVHPKL